MVIFLKYNTFSERGNVVLSRISDRFLEYFYYFICVLFFGAFIFEVPSVVFWSPVYLIIAFLFYSVYIKRELNYSASFFVLIIFAFAYVTFIYVPGSSLYYQAYIYIHAVIMYAVGLNFLTEKTIEQRKKFIEYLFLIISVFYIAYVGLTFWNYFYNTEADLQFRFYYSIWYHSVTKPATVISMCFVFPLAYGSYALFYLKWFHKIIGALLIGLTVYVNFQTGTRTLVYVLPFLLAAQFIFWLIFEKKKIIPGVVFSVLIFVSFAAAIYFLILNRESFAKQFAGSGFARFFDSHHTFDLRIQYSMNVLRNFRLDYFGGGVNSQALGTPHNIWLYIYDWGGIVPFCIFCVLFVPNERVRFKYVPRLS